MPVLSGRPMLRGYLHAGAAVFADFIRSGTFLRYFAASHRYAFFFLIPFLDVVLDWRRAHPTDTVARVVVRGNPLLAARTDRPDISTGRVRANRVDELRGLRLRHRIGDAAGARATRPNCSASRHRPQQGDAGLRTRQATRLQGHRVARGGRGQSALRGL